MQAVKSVLALQPAIKKLCQVRSYLFYIFEFKSQVQ